MHHLPASRTLVIFHFMAEVELQVPFKLLLHFRCEEFIDECFGKSREEGLGLEFFQFPQMPEHGRVVGHNMDIRGLYCSDLS